MDNEKVFTFKGFEIDCGRRELRRDGVLVPVEPQVLDLIAEFAANAGRVLSRDHLINTVWGGGSCRTQPLPAASTPLAPHLGTMELRSA